MQPNGERLRHSGLKRYGDPRRSPRRPASNSETSICISADVHRWPCDVPPRCPPLDDATSGMSFRDSKAFTDATAQLLATTLPPTLEEIRLEITASGATSVSCRVPPMPFPSPLQQPPSSAAERTPLRALACRWAATRCCCAAQCGCRRAPPLPFRVPFECHRECLPSAFRVPFECHRECRLEYLSSAIRVLSGCRPEAPRSVVRVPLECLLITCSPLPIAQLPTLRVLEMNDCLLTCAIPDAIGECVALEELILSGNKMAGPLPRTVGGCVSLRMLHAQNNEFNGELPAELSG